jgi:hypothetical protein
VIDTAETISAVWLNRWNDFGGAIDTAETDFGDRRSDYFGEYDAICKTVLAC